MSAIPWLNGLHWRPYEYRGTGTDTLTPPDFAALLDERERQEMEAERAALDARTATRSAARQGRIPLQPCGTLAAYQRHMRRSEDPCDECRAAVRAKMRERRFAS